jgi:hypothetical protein
VTYLHAVGRKGEAIGLLQAVLADRQRVLGPDHPDTLASRNDLAAGYGAAGQPDEAIALYQVALADCERVLGPSHPLTVTVRENAASTSESARPEGPEA